MAAGAQTYTLDGEAVENWAVLPLYAELRNIRFDPERMEDSRPEKLTLGVISSVESDAQVEIIRIFHPQPQN